MMIKHRTLILSFVLMALQIGPHLPMVQAIPPAPAMGGRGYFIQDYAAIIPHDSQSFERISQYQEKAFVDHQTPIIVVTIESMKPYGYHRSDFEVMTRQWFDRWQIGTQRENGLNRGILVLFVRQERLCRIELGGDWGTDFDKHCVKIMQHTMLPYFKSEDYRSGLELGTKRLLEMAKSGPLNGPPFVLSFNPMVVVFGGLGILIVLMFIALAWHERENAGALLSVIPIQIIPALIYAPMIVVPILLVGIPALVIYRRIRGGETNDVPSFSLFRSPKVWWQDFKS